MNRANTLEFQVSQSNLNADPTAFGERFVDRTAEWQSGADTQLTCWTA